MKIKLLFLFFSFLNLLSNIGTYGFKNFSNYYFVETGAFSGEGIQKALNAKCFNEIYSIELDPEHIHTCTVRFKNKNNVKIVVGSSSDKLWDIIKDMDKPITFWLDAHTYPGKPEQKNTPIMEELEQIKKHPIKTHTILIDDMSCCGTLAFDYIARQDLIEKIKSINPAYVISFLPGGDADEVRNNVLVATVIN